MFHLFLRDNYYTDHLKKQRNFHSYCNIQCKTDGYNSISRRFGPSEVTVNVLITDGATMSDSEWSCAFDAYL